MKFSIITVCWNAETTIGPTIESVLGQKGADIEYIIVDGQSTDRTLQVVAKYRHRLAKVISEPDSGIYDAMNKGAKLASGDVLLFLNAGDRLAAPDTLQQVAKAFTDPKLDLVYGDVRQVDDGSQESSVVKFDRVNAWFLADSTICHQSTLIKKELFQKVGDYNIKYKFAADYDWLLRALVVHRAKTKYLNQIICEFSMTGVSNNPNNRQRVLDEYDQISAQYFNPVLIYAKRLYRLIWRLGARGRKLVGRLR